MTVHRNIQLDFIYVYARPLSSLRGSLHKLYLTCRRTERVKCVMKTHLLRFFLFFLFLSFVPRSCCSSMMTWCQVCMCAKEEWKRELPITNDSFFYGYEDNTTIFITWANDTIEKVFNGVLQGLLWMEKLFIKIYFYHHFVP